MFPRPPVLRGALHLNRLPPSRSPIPLPVASSSSKLGFIPSSSVPPSPLPRTSEPGEYFVARSETGNLPVYSDSKRGNIKTTTIRKLDGDIMALRDDIHQFLAGIHLDPLKPSPAVFVRPTTRQVVVKGHWVQEIKGWLEGRGF